MTDNRESLHELIVAALERKSNDSGKWVEVRRFFSHLIGVPYREIGAKWMSEPKQIHNRLGEARKYATLLIVLCEPELLPKVEVALDKMPQVSSVATCSKRPDGMWDLFSLTSRSPEVANGLRKAFPGIEVKEGRTPSPLEQLQFLRLDRVAVSTIPMILEDRIRRMVDTAIASSAAVMLVGPPGTGKSTILRETIAKIQANPGRYGFSKPPKEPRWVTPEESWSTRELVGGETVDEHGLLRFRPGHVLNAIAANEWLILDEANRADMDKIFGALLTWLSSAADVHLGTVSTGIGAPSIKLGWGDSEECEVEEAELLHSPSNRDLGDDRGVRYLAGREWRLLGTYNALDAQRVFKIGQALGRRFRRIPIPPMAVERFEEVLLAEAAGEVSILAAIRKVTGLYRAHFEDPGSALGPALFLWMPEYIRTNLRLRGLMSEEPLVALDAPGPPYEASEDIDESDIDDVEVDQVEVDDAEVESLIAEAYLASAGVWLAKMAPEEFEQLKQRAGDSLSPKEWKWIESLLPMLG